jgi:hypothetical protein
LVDCNMIFLILVLTVPPKGAAKAQPTASDYGQV